MTTGLFPAGIGPANVRTVISKAGFPAGALAVAHDGRTSSRALCEAVIGSDTVGPLPLAAFSAEVAKGGYAGGIYLGAAHLPQEFAGVMALDADGLPLPLNAETAPGSSTPSFNAISDIAAYADGVSERLDLERIALVPRTFVFDLMYGSAGGTLESLLGPLPGNLKLLTTREYAAETVETITPDPFSASHAELAKKVKKNHAEAALTLSGDGRRLGALSNNGEPVGEETLAALLLLEKVRFRGEKGILLRHAAAPRIIDALADSLSVEVEECFGDLSGFARRMADGGCILGVLPCREFAFPGPSPFPDALQAALSLIELNSHTDLPLHLVAKEHLSGLPRRGRASTTIPIAPMSDPAQAIERSVSLLSEEGLSAIHQYTELVIMEGDSGESRLSLRSSLDGGSLELFADTAGDDDALKLIGHARRLILRNVI